MISERIEPLLGPEGEVAWDPLLEWDELVGLLAHVLAGDLPELTHEGALAYLDANLPDAKVAELISWPGEWFGNRWYEEVALLPEEAAGHLLERCGRELPGAPDFDED